MNLKQALQDAARLRLDTAEDMDGVLIRLFVDCIAVGRILPDSQVGDLSVAHQSLLDYKDQIARRAQRVEGANIFNEALKGESHEETK